AWCEVGERGGSALVAAVDQYAHRAGAVVPAGGGGGAGLGAAAAHRGRGAGHGLPCKESGVGSLVGPVRVLRRVLLAVVRGDLPAAVHLAGRMCTAAAARARGVSAAAAAASPAALRPATGPRRAGPVAVVGGTGRATAA